MDLDAFFQEQRARYQNEQSVLHSWVEYIKIAFIFLQVLVLTYLFVEAILSRLRKTGQYDIVSFMFAADIVILCALCYFDWGKKLIACFFFMIFFQNFIAVVGLYHMCHGLKTPERKHLRRKTGIYFSLVTMVYLIVFIMTFTKTMGPICTKTDLYPPVMDISNGLFVLNALFHFYAHSQDYWLKWEEHPLIQPYVGKEEEMDWEPISILKQKFQGQMKVFVVFQVVIIALLAVIYGMIYFKLDQISCSDDGLTWIYETTQGSLFMMVYMVFISLQAVMIENVFYRVPKELGYYEANQNDNSVDSQPWYNLPPRRRWWDDEQGVYRDVEVPRATTGLIHDDMFHKAK